MTEFDMTQIYKSHNLFLKLRQQPIEWLVKHEIEICENCHGTGLNATKIQEGYSWNGMDYCNECYGVGYIGIKASMNFDGTHYVCPYCQSIGCNKCERTGFVDWIQHAMGKRKEEE